MNLINIQDLKFKYPKATHNTLDISHFHLKKGEKIFLFGPSGCGKTTFLETLAGVLVPQSGSIKIKDLSLEKATAAERDAFRAAHIGYIFQSFNLIPYLSVEENISLPLYLSKLRRQRVPIDKQKEEIHFLCKQLGIEELLDKPVTELSVGQQQRVAAARALLGKPDLILADEPTSSLDFDHREKFIKLLFTLCEENNIAILFVSHDRTLQGLFDRSLSLAEINKATKIQPENVTGDL